MSTTNRSGLDRKNVLATACRSSSRRTEAERSSAFSRTERMAAPASAQARPLSAKPPRAVAPKSAKVRRETFMKSGKLAEAACYPVENKGERDGNYSCQYVIIRRLQRFLSHSKSCIAIAIAASATRDRPWERPAGSRSADRLDFKRLCRAGPPQTAPGATGVLHDFRCV